MGRSEDPLLAWCDDTLARLSQIPEAVNVIKARHFWTWGRSDEHERRRVHRLISQIRTDILALRERASDDYQRGRR